MALSLLPMNLLNVPIAGMPAPYTLTDIARARLEVIAFFLAVFLVSALLVRWLWNGLRKSFTRLPYLNYWRSLWLVALWGLLFTVVLAMVSGARELMTPGAWERNGATYQLKSKGE
jgi:hypothetical protein